MGSITINSIDELDELRQLLFGDKQFIMINEPSSDIIDYTDENIIFI